MTKTGSNGSSSSSSKHMTSGTAIILEQRKLVQTGHSDEHECSVKHRGTWAQAIFFKINFKVELMAKSLFREAVLLCTGLASCTSPVWAGTLSAWTVTMTQGQVALHGLSRSS